MTAATATSPRQQFIARVKEIAAQTAEQAGQATGPQASALWDAANLWAILGFDMPLCALDEAARIAAKADEAAERGGYDGPKHQPELVALLTPRPAPRGPRRVITATGWIEVSDTF